MWFINVREKFIELFNTIREVLFLLKIGTRRERKFVFLRCLFRFLKHPIHRNVFVHYLWYFLIVAKKIDEWKVRANHRRHYLRLERSFRDVIRGFHWIVDQAKRRLLNHHHSVREHRLAVREEYQEHVADESRLEYNKNQTFVICTNWHTRSSRIVIVGWISCNSLVWPLYWTSRLMGDSRFVDVSDGVGVALSCTYKCSIEFV